MDSYTLDFIWVIVSLLSVTLAGAAAVLALLYQGWKIFYDRPALVSGRLESLSLKKIKPSAGNPKIQPPLKDLPDHINSVLLAVALMVVGGVTLCLDIMPEALKPGGNIILFFLFYMGLNLFIDSLTAMGGLPISQTIYLYQQDGRPYQNRNVFISGRLFGELKGPDNEISTDVSCVVEGQYILAAQVGNRIIFHYRDAFQTGIFLGSKTVFILAVAGLAGFMVADGFHFKRLSQEVVWRWLPWLVPSLIFWFSLGWVRTDVLIRRSELLLAQIQPAGLKPRNALFDQSAGRLPHVGLAWLAVGLFLIAALWRVWSVARP